MKSKIFKFLLSLSICIVLIIASSPFVSAASPYCTFPWTQPKADEINGYMEIFCEYNGEPCVMVYSFQSLYPYSGTPKNYINGYVSVNPTGLTVYFFNNGDFPLCLVWSFYRSNPSSMFGQSYETGITPAESSSSLVYSPWLPNGWVIKHVRCYGILSPNTDSLNYFAGSSAYGPIIYGNDTLVNAKLDVIVALLQSQSNADVVSAIQQSSDRVINAGSDNAQPDFGDTNGKLDNTVGQIESIEGSYQIDQAATNTALSTGSSFLQGSDMQRASIQVKTWIERFSSENRVVTGFLIAAMVLGLCFWVIGRKAGSE